MAFKEIEFRTALKEDSKGVLGQKKHSFELNVERNGHVINYSADTQEFAIVECCYDIVIQQDDTLQSNPFIVVFDVAQTDGHTKSHYVYFIDGIPNRHGEVGSEIIESLKDIPTFVLKGSSDETLLIENNVAFTLIGFDDTDEELLEKYLLQSNLTKLLAHKNLIWKLAALFVIAIGVSVWLWNTTQEIRHEKVQETKYVSVDPYAEYRSQVSGHIETQELVNTVISLWFKLQMLPSGWQLKDITLEKGVLTSLIKFEGGKVSDVDAFAVNAGLEQYYSRNHYAPVFTVALKPNNDLSTYWKENWQAFRYSYDLMLDTGTTLGSTVTTFDIKDSGQFSSAELLFTFSHSNISFLSLLGNLTKDKPIFITSLKVTQKEELPYVGLTIKYKIVGTTGNGND